MNKKQKRRIIALIILVAILSVMLLSIAYILEHSGHECTGSKCPICAAIEQCCDNLKILDTAITACILVFLFMRVVKSEQCVSLVYFNNSLISQKVRMNN